jgi:ATP-dependent Clp protease ATP-binding subunit ClpC
MTSNVGFRQLKDFGQGVDLVLPPKWLKQMIIRKALLKMLKKTFAPEFLNRIDDVIVFNSLEKHDIDLISKSN